MQRRFNNDYLQDDMVGNWRCLKCDVTVDYTTKPKGCGKGGCFFDYREVSLEDAHTGIVGHVDAYVRDGDQLYCTEFKTVKLEDFKKLQAPLSEHTIRTRLYLFFSATLETPLKKYVNKDYAYVVYAAKGFGEKIDDPELLPDRFSPFKSFKIKRDDLSLQTYLSKARAVTVAVNGGGVPCRLCSSPFDTRASKCSVANVCFGGKYTTETTWLNSQGNAVHSRKKLVDFNLCEV